MYKKYCCKCGQVLFSYVHSGITGGNYCFECYKNGIWSK